METLAIVLSVASIIIVISQQSKIIELEKKIRKLSQKIRDTEESKLEESKLEESKLEESKLEESKLEESKLEESKLEESKLEESKLEESKLDRAEAASKVKSNFPVKQQSKKQNILIDKFLSNWTGILGSILLVMGFSFLGIFVAINMSPFSRFLLFVTVSVILIGVSITLEKVKRMKKTAIWIRSTAGAIFLFSCVGSGGITGLQWVDNNIAALFLLILGITVNIYLGHISQKEIIASTHVFLSLLAISIAPATLITFLIAASVCLYGIFLTYRKSWDINLLIIISLYFIFHIYWFNKIPQGSFSISTQATSLTAILIIFLVTLLSHYRNVYSVEKFQIVPFLTHFLNWFFLGTGLYLYSGIIPFKIILLALGSIVALLIAKRAKTLNIRWLYVTDTLIANFLMILAIVSFYPKGVNPFFISSFLLIESIIFTWITILEKEKLLNKVAYFFNLVFSFSVISTGLVNKEYNSSNFANNILLITITILSGLFYFYYIKKSDVLKTTDKHYKSVLSSVFPVFVLVVLVNTFEYKLGSYSLLLLSPFLLINNKYNKKALSITAQVTSIIAYILIWMESLWNGNELMIFLELIPPVIISILFVKRSKSFGLYTLGAHLTISSYLLLNPISIYLPGSAWLIMSIINLELSKKLKKMSQQLKHTGILQVLLYFLRHYLIIIDEKYKIIFDIIIIAVLIYWLIRTKKDLEEKSKIYNFITKHLLEIIYISFSVFVILEADIKWQPTIWITISLISLLYKRKNNDPIDRIRLYSILFTWAASFHLSFINGTIDKSTIPSVITIILHTLYLLIFKRKSKLMEINLKDGYSILEPLRNKINNNVNKYTYFPFFISVALFILFKFNEDIITLMFVIESLIIFILSIKLKENIFRVISMLGITGSMIRLIIFDLNNSETVIRAIVFIGMGTILVIMSVIYNRFMGKTQ